MKQHIRSTENIHSTKKSPYFDLHAKTLSIFLADLADSTETNTICVSCAICACQNTIYFPRGSRRFRRHKKSPYFACQNTIYFFLADLADSADTDTIPVFCVICVPKYYIFLHADFADSADTKNPRILSNVRAKTLYIFSAQIPQTQ